MADEDEDDDLFPSGPWTGFYTYGDPSQRFRQDLELTFADGRMTGTGQDGIGRFAITGRYDRETVECTWVKTYVGAHSVDYRGWREGKGIWGKWTIVHASGGFHIWPRSAGEAAAQEIALELPVGQKR